MAGIQTPEEAAKLKELEDSLDFLKERRQAEEEKTAREKAKVETNPQNPLLGASQAEKKQEHQTAPLTAIPAATANPTAPAMPAAAAKTADTADSAVAQKADNKEEDKTEKNTEETSKPVESLPKVSEMSALDRARASRFAPPKHILEKAGGIKPLEEKPAKDQEKKDGRPEDVAGAPQKSITSNPRSGGVAPAITPPKEVARPQTMVAAPKPVAPKPVSPQPALKLAMTVEEAQKQGVIAPGTYGKKDDKDNVLKPGDTKEIPDLSGIVEAPVPISPVAPKTSAPETKTVSKEEKKVEKPSDLIKNPLPTPKKHEAKDMDFDHKVANLDMHFDVVDMSGIDFFDIN